MKIHYLFLGLSIVFEVIGTTFLSKSEGFSKLVPTAVFVLCYAVCFYFLSLALRGINLGVAYALWGGIGIILTTLVSVFLFKQKIDLPAIIGIVFIVIGTVIINFFSKATQH